MLDYAEPVTRLIDEFKRLPGIGQKSAQRLAFYVLRTPEADVERFVEALREVKLKIVFCSVCNNLTDANPCRYCSSPSRDRSMICIVEEPYNLVAVEKTRGYHGLYHVLHGVISPIDGIGPEQIHVPQLLDRVRDEGVLEVIVATDADIEGEATALYLQRALEPLGTRVTRPAHGLPVGGDLEYADEVTMLKAMEGRRDL